MKVALVHDWLTLFGGGEKVLQAIYELFPGHIYTLFTEKKSLERQFLSQTNLTTSFLNNFYGIEKYYRYLLPLFPYAIESIDVSQANLVLSSSHSVAKGILTHSKQLHICYCHTPMRYAWDLCFEHLAMSGLGKGLQGIIARMILHKIRLWDSVSSSRVDHFIANSKYVSQRIWRCYRRESTVIHPPVDIEFFSDSIKKDEGYFLTSSRLVPYKKVDVLIDAFKLLPNEKLIVIGTGPEMMALKKKSGSNIEIIGYQPPEKLREYMSHAKAFIHMAEEDFGIAVVEAQATGTPVIALGKGGALETVVDGITGTFVVKQTVSSLLESIKNFLSSQTLYDPKIIKEHASQFCQKRFNQKYETFVKNAWNQFCDKEAL